MRSNGIRKATYSLLVLTTWHSRYYWLLCLDVSICKVHSVSSETESAALAVTAGRHWWECWWTTWTDDFSDHQMAFEGVISGRKSAVNPLDSGSNYSATSNNTMLVRWPLMGGLLHLVQWGREWAGCCPTQAPPRCINCDSPPINSQCTNHCSSIWRSTALRF